MIARVDELETFLAHARARVDDALDRCLPPLGTPPTILHEAMRTAVLAGGKRLRGALVLATCEMTRGDEDAAIAPACAVELVHASSLVLDDLPSMDDATMRRGRPCLHRVVGEATAILTAIGLLNTAYAVVWQSTRLGVKTSRAISLRLGEAVGARGLIGGQIADLAATGRPVDVAGVESTYRQKTAALFIAAAESGAWVAGARDREVAALDRYALNLGLAFQIQDDLHDYTADAQTAGKDTGLDRDKTTFVSLCGVEGARQRVDELIDAAVKAVAPFRRRATRLVAIAEWVRGQGR